MDNGWLSMDVTSSQWMSPTPQWISRNGCHVVRGCQLTQETRAWTWMMTWQALPGRPYLQGGLLRDDRPSRHQADADGDGDADGRAWRIMLATSQDAMNSRSQGLQCG